MEREKVIKILKFYGDIDGHIAFARSVLAGYDDEYYGLHSGNSFGNISTKTNRISNPTEAAVLNIPDYISREMSEARSLIERLTALKAAILAEICKLPLAEKSIITYFYFKGLKWLQISRLMHYSETHCKRVRNKALEKLGVFFDQNESLKNFNYPF